ncbi:MAG: NAD(P)/FAD-dependent oxidoreductase [Candidatus Omnitrophica bacterium]|nr:NAD(P)/FAD-dependent oxidoreductase [Candidatus Omnitrophota bacterium]MBU4488216.1 NAD(P)/FAD-dependent oxidoreductase [Candidatus Omnitrophota bacterium]
MLVKAAYDAIVIGGGPAGMMASGRAAERGKKVLLVEKNDMLGRKLLISGSGRSNITNAGSIDEHIANFGRSGKFLRNAFSEIFNTELIDFFKARGVVLKVERGKRVFPESGRSKDILDALKRYLHENRVDLILAAEVKDVIQDESGTKKVILARGVEYAAPSVAICTGGVSYPETGSTGFGFDAAKRLGHQLVDPRPALVPLVTESALPRTWQGLSLDNVKAAVIGDGERIAECFGDMIFTHFGLSGPIILDLSGPAYDLLQEKNCVEISLDLKPALDLSKLNNRLIRELAGNSNKALKNILKEILPAKMIPGFIDYCGLSKDKKANQITARERERLVKGLKDLRFRIKKTRPIEEAIVTRGGVNTKEIDPKTMESRLIKGLFFAGELIDVDAKTGGYNMQAAFSTGYVCGNNL